MGIKSINAKKENGPNSRPKIKGVQKEKEA